MFTSNQSTSTTSRNSRPKHDLRRGLGLNDRDIELTTGNRVPLTWDSKIAIDLKKRWFGQVEYRENTFFDSEILTMG